MTDVVAAPINPINTNGYTYRIDAINYLSPNMGVFLLGAPYGGAGIDSQDQQQRMIKIDAKYTFGTAAT